MATIQFPKKGTGGLAAAPIAATRVINEVVDMSTDVTMGTATDEIVLVDLPAGTVVVAAGIEQLVAGTGTGTLAARVGTTSMSTTLLATADAGETTTAAAVDTVVVPTAGATLNVVGAVAARTTGKIRVWAIVVESQKPGRYGQLAARDTSL